jgi:hypothetical protein
MFPPFHGPDAVSPLSSLLLRHNGSLEAGAFGAPKACGSSFGFGGVNAHVVLEAPARSKRTAQSERVTERSSYERKFEGLTSVLRMAKDVQWMSYLTAQRSHRTYKEVSRESFVFTS